MDFTSELLGSSGWGGDAGPAMSSGGAYGGGFSQPVSSTVGGLTINNKPDWLLIVGAVLLGAAVVWAVKH